jgi:outer membrane lipoprotein-sorting protein
MTVRVTGIALLALAALIASAPHGAAETPSLAARAAHFPALRTATAGFAQEREVSLVDEVLRAEGTLALAAPASFRLDLTTPEPMALIAAGPTMLVVDAQGKTLSLPPEVAGLAEFARTLTDLMLGARAPQGFTEAWRDADTVVLMPRAEAASPFTEIALRFPASGPLPEEIMLRERGGDRTIIRLHDIALNPVVDPARFAPPAAKGSP